MRLLKLFDWAFENFSTQKAFSKGEEIGTYETTNGSIIPLVAEKDIFILKIILLKKSHL